MKDNFSEQSNLYKAFRPTYPNALYDFILELVPEKNCAWDCGTGNGQVATELAKQFKQVHATDISRRQLEQAPNHPTIEYSIQKAEEPAFPDDTFNLITVAQAIHWFDLDQFYKEVYRTIKKGGVFAVIGYGLAETFPEADHIISRLFHDITGPYWDEERRYLDEKYETLPFPFRNIESQEFSIVYEWDFEYLVGYLRTWSAVIHYKNQTGHSPLELIHDELKSCWNNKIRPVHFPIFTRIARVDA
ncbi:MAG: methyltransferase domain-containing protein [Bacteroidetes bacterium]|jgi:SAM-dependent methyltransferase|nr:methyltransferase domain-containing protein [Bacteroidota bacterium]